MSRGILYANLPDGTHTCPYSLLPILLSPDHVTTPCFSSTMMISGHNGSVTQILSDDSKMSMCICIPHAPHLMHATGVFRRRAGI